MAKAQGNEAARTCPFCGHQVSAGNPTTNLAQHIKMRHPDRFQIWRITVGTLGFYDRPDEEPVA